MPLCPNCDSYLASIGSLSENSRIYKYLGAEKKCKLICKYLNPKLTLHQVGAVIKCQRTKVGFFCISLATILLYLRQQCISGVPCVSQQWYTPNSKRRNATLVQIKQALNPRRLANLNLQLNMIVAP